MSGSHFHAGRAVFQYLAGLAVLMACSLGRGASIESPDLKLDYTPASGTRILFHGVPVVRASSLQLFAPGWRRGYYSSTSSPAQITQDDKQIVVTHRVGKGVEFSAVETIRLVDPHRIEITLQGQLTSDLPAKMEWSIGQLNAFALYGGEYAADDAAATAIVPMPPRDTHNCTVISSANRIRFSGPMGTIRVSMGDGHTMALLDGRLELGRHWSQEIPSFWLGCLSDDVPVGKPFKYTVTIDYQPADELPAAAAVDALGTVHAIDDAAVPEPKPIQIIPQPKKLKWNDGQYRLHSPLEQSIQFRRSSEWTDPERYAIHCDPNTIELRAADERGRFYGLQTLRQMVQNDINGPFIPACDIDDWPSSTFRGVHLFPGKGALAFHRKLIENIFARFKINHVVLECEFAQWQTNPKLWTDISVPKDDLREYAKIARANFVEPIPLVQSLGHVEWMFKNGQNRDLPEDPRACWAYDATNPATYDFIEKIYDELIDVFHPAVVHIGHDEVVDRGEYPYREESKKSSVAELFAMDVKKLDGYFRPKGIRMMLWGDMLLTKDQSSDPAANAPDAAQAKQMRDAIPKDAIICDWHYQPVDPAAYKSLAVFKEAGLQTIASTWYNPINIASFAQGEQQIGALGLLQTTWAGFNLDEAAMHKELRQFSAYILAAEYAWSGQTIAADQLPYRVDEVFAEAMNPKARSGKKLAGATIDLSSLSNVKFGETPLDIALFPAGARFDGVRFDLNHNGACALRGSLIRHPLPESASIRIDSSANAIAFLQATAFHCEAGERVGRYQVDFADGSSELIPLEYAANIRALDDPAITPDATLAWSGKNTHGLPVGFRMFTWTNPHPEKPIARVTFSGEHPFASPVLIGMTLLRDAERK